MNTISPIGPSAEPSTAPQAETAAATDFGLLNDLCELAQRGNTGGAEFNTLNDVIYRRLLAVYPSSTDDREAA